ncbi:Fibroleukin [Exaiptasia diaphana]|nr:Fibroleukin [Exaiptasia diaphana]
MEHDIETVLAPTHHLLMVERTVVVLTTKQRPATHSHVLHYSKKHFFINVIVLKNCAEFYRSGFKRSGVYVIDPDGDGKFNVSCDQKTAGGGWTVFQKRQDGSVDFYRGWNDYKNGFGDLNGEFWLGLDKIHRLTKERKQRLRVDLEDTKGKTAYAEYDNFAVANEQDNYRMSFKSYSVEPPLNGHLGERPEVYR